MVRTCLEFFALLTLSRLDFHADKSGVRQSKIYKGTIHPERVSHTTGLHNEREVVSGSDLETANLQTGNHTSFNEHSLGTFEKSIFTLLAKTNVK